MAASACYASICRGIHLKPLLTICVYLGRAEEPRAMKGAAFQNSLIPIRLRRSDPIPDRRARLSLSIPSNRGPHTGCSSTSCSLQFLFLLAANTSQSCALSKARTIREMMMGIEDAKFYTSVIAGDSKTSLFLHCLIFQLCMELYREKCTNCKLTAGIGWQEEIDTRTGFQPL